MESSLSQMSSRGSAVGAITYHGGMTGISYDPERLREIGERYGVARLDVFGSASRGDGHSESDIEYIRPQVVLDARPLYAA
jgi:hypothetical protein